MRERTVIASDLYFMEERQGGWVSAVWEGHRDAKTMIYRNNLSSGRGFVAHGVTGPITQDHNRENVHEEEFVDVKKLDFRMKNPSSSSVDAGLGIEGSPEVLDGNPDLGAYERSVNWKAGADLKE